MRAAVHLPRLRRGGLHRGWLTVVWLTVALGALPVASLLLLSLAPSEGSGHLMSTVLPRAIWQSLVLMAGVGAATLLVGTATAWIVTMYRFPGRDLADRLLVIPLAMPTYIVAYCYVEILDAAGPVQTLLRGLIGAASPRDYWFPEIRSSGGAILIMSAVLYPYVYLAARASFVQQSVCVLEVARTLGRTPFGAFIEVALPLARPALAAGVTLALMECLNDLGAVQHLGVETLSASVYATWLQRSDLAGAARIALAMLATIALLLALERLARGRARFHHTTGKYRALPFATVGGWRGLGLFSLCALPFLLGFGMPVGVLISNVLTVGVGMEPWRLWSAVANSLLIATLSAIAAVALAVVLTYALRVHRSPSTAIGVRAAGLGYVIPGTVLALGLIYPLTALDNTVAGLVQRATGLNPGLILSGSIAALVIAGTVRFLAVSLGQVEAGFNRISPNLDAAARTLGQSELATLTRVHLPMLLPAIGAAGLLVFVDVMKELPATLLLRPLNFETLATSVYNLASLEQFEQAAFGALAIVAAGLVPVLALHRAVAMGRAGSPQRSQDEG